MAFAQKDLTALNSKIDLNTVGESSGEVILHYVSGAGTVEVQASMNGTDYIAVQVTNENTGVAAASATAAGLYSVNNPGYRFLRAIKTVGTASCVVVFGTAYNG